MENEKIVESFKKLKNCDMTSTKAPSMVEINFEDEKLKIQVELDVISTSCSHSLKLTNNTIDFCVNLWNSACDIVSNYQMPTCQPLHESYHS